MNKINQFAKITMVAGLYAITGGALHASSASEEVDADSIASKTAAAVEIDPDFMALLALNPKMINKRAEIVQDAAVKCVLADIDSLIKAHINSYVEAANNAGVKIAYGIVRKLLIENLK